MVSACSALQRHAAAKAPTQFRPHPSVCVHSQRPVSSSFDSFTPKRAPSSCSEPAEHCFCAWLTRAYPSCCAAQRTISFHTYAQLMCWRERQPNKPAANTIQPRTIRNIAVLSTPIGLQAHLPSPSEPSGTPPQPTQCLRTHTVRADFTTLRAYAQASQLLLRLSHAQLLRSPRPHELPCDLGIVPDVHWQTRVQQENVNTSTGWVCVTHGLQFSKQLGLVD